MSPVSYLETGVLFCDDNRPRLREFPDECIDLVYLDPPFFSNRNYEVIWGDEAEVRSFQDRWEGGIHHYVEWMEYRLVELHRILKPTGSLYLHCDPSASHYLKIRLDEIFGLRQFQNEIAWKRFSAKNDPQRFGRSHDSILFYTKTQNYTWNPQYGPFEDDYVEQNYRYVEEETGRRYRLSDLTANKPGGDVDYEWQGMRPYRGRHWAYSREKMDQFLAEGRIIFRRTGMPVLSATSTRCWVSPCRIYGPMSDYMQVRVSASATRLRNPRRYSNGSSLPAPSAAMLSSTPSAVAERPLQLPNNLGESGSGSISAPPPYN